MSDSQTDAIQTVRERDKAFIVEEGGSVHPYFAITGDELDRVEAVVKAALTYCEEPTAERFAELQAVAADYDAALDPTEARE